MGWAVPSVREAFLTSFGTRHRDVLPRRVSAKGPLASLGATKRRGFGATPLPCLFERSEKSPPCGRERLKGRPLASFGATKGGRSGQQKGSVRGDKRGGVRGDKKGAFRAIKSGGSARLDSDFFFIYNNILCYPLS